MAKGGEKTKKKKVSWGWIILLIILLLLAWAEYDHYKECVEDCTYLYDCSCYCYGEGYYDCSDNCEELKSCIRSCDY